MSGFVFDPFNDFEVAGYLRNVRKDKNEIKIKHFEHDLFRANLDKALAYLSAKKVLSYGDFLEVHRILFSDYYPWAGQDRSITMPDRAVVKGKVLFCHPQDSRRAVESGFRLGQDSVAMAQKPGEVMGLFAYGHPFLDGNGRTMLLVHLELTYRAGFSICWADTSKSEYLEALGREIDKPGCGILDAYLLKFKGPRLDRNEWGKSILSMKGLDGLDESNQIVGSLTDPAVQERYRQFEKQRGYAYQSAVVHLSED
jgi:cell filamentation protein